MEEVAKTLISDHVLHLVFKVSFPFKPVDLGFRVFPDYVSFGVLNIPGSCNNDIPFPDPHLFVPGTGDSAHADNSVHALQGNSFRAQ